MGNQPETRAKKEPSSSIHTPTGVKPRPEIAARVTSRRSPPASTVTVSVPARVASPSGRSAIRPSSSSRRAWARRAISGTADWLLR